LIILVLGAVKRKFPSFVIHLSFRLKRMMRVSVSPMSTVSGGVGDGGDEGGGGLSPGGGGTKVVVLDEVIFSGVG
jgi:hypothetical protein